MELATRTSRKGYILLPTHLLLYYMAYLATAQVPSKMVFRPFRQDLFRPLQYLYLGTSAWMLPSRRPWLSCPSSGKYSMI